MEEQLFGNIGGKLKTVAFIVCLLGFAGSILFTVVTWMELADSYWYVDGWEYILAAIIGAVGCLVSWLSTLALYGLGQLIENSDTIAEKITQIEMKKDKNVSQSSPNTSTTTSNGSTISNTNGSVYGPWKG